MENPTQQRRAERAGLRPVSRDEEIRVVRDIRFAVGSNDELSLDLYLPATQHSPATVYFHGGGWRTGARTDHADIRCGGLARRGIAVASVDYRLTPNATFPAQLLDARAAVDWLGENGSDYGLDVERIGAWGASAGGHLAALLGTRHPDADEPQQLARVVAVAAMFAPLLITELLTRGGGPERPLLPDASVELIREADPFERIDAESASFLLLHGDADQLIDSDLSERFHRRLAANGIESTLVRLARAGHEDERFESDAILSMIAGFFWGALS